MRFTILMLFSIFVSFSSIISTTAQEDCELDLISSITALVEAQHDADTDDTGAAVRGIATVQEELASILDDCEGVMGQVYLPERFVSMNGEYAFNYPENWFFDVLEPGIVITGTSTDIVEVINSPDPVAIEAGKIGVVVIYAELQEGLNIEGDSLEEITESLRTSFSGDARVSPTTRLSISDHRAQSFRIESAEYLIYIVVVDYNGEYGIFLGISNPVDSDEIVLYTDGIAGTLLAPAPIEETFEATFFWDDYSIDTVIAISDLIEGGGADSAVLSHNGEYIAWLGEDSICVYAFANSSQNCGAPMDRFNGRSERLEWSFDDQYIAFTENWTRFLDEPDIWVYDVENKRVTNLTNDGEDNIMQAEGEVLIDTTPTWHPDGSLYFVRNDRESKVASLYRINLDEPNPELVYAFNAFETSNLIYTSVYTNLNGAMEFSPDGETLAVLIRGFRPEDEFSGIYLVDMTENDPELELLLSQSALSAGMLPEYVERAGPPLINSIAWSADGSKIYTIAGYTQFLAGQTIFQIDVETGEVISIPDLSEQTQDGLFTEENSVMPLMFDLPLFAVMVPGSNIPVGLNRFQENYGLTLYSGDELERIYQTEMEPLQPTANSSASADGKLLMNGYLFLPAD